jgi:hypothetical protein
LKRGTGGSAMMRLGVDSKRHEHARVHVVGTDQYGQFHDLALIEMRPQRIMASV